MTKVITIVKTIQEPQHIISQRTNIIKLDRTVRDDEGTMKQLY